MATTDSGRQSGALPSIASINYLDLEKIERESSEYSQKQSMTAPPLISPSAMYSGPPPPYSYPSSTASSVVGLHTSNGYISPASSRTLSEDAKDPPPPQSTKLLPSIHEALSGEQPRPYTSVSASVVPLPPAMQPASNLASSASIHRQYPDGNSQGPPNPYAQGPPPLPYPPYPAPDRQPQSHHPAYSSTERAPSRFSAVNSREAPFSSIHPMKTTSSPQVTARPSPYSIQRRQSPPPQNQTPRSTAPMQSPYGYGSYRPAYSQHPHSPGMSQHPPYPLQHPPWRSDGSEIDRAEEMRKAASKTNPLTGQTYGESVKRHLDNFDFETSLNEIAEASGRALEFSQHYGNCAHQNQRSGPSPGSIPSLQECEELLRRQTGVLDAITRIRECIITRQQQALAEQRSQDQAYKGSSEFGDDGSAYQDKLDGSGGFAGADAKKRRGRAAPPGRCHSCNRAETPEWRRGPDGARTLCNACGLHYAKLTRKMGSSKTSMGSSNLRPKDAGPASPH
ncbi:MAG: hypothetical protein FRX48_03642 [Lasallia pustulata]|uniref:GATA-type domain-containing protein n=1 Tax=Lasallia pustulata TaxID=136370 RepID=A0A5M8PSU4_9LECA|nr:MAG: hypothetical protein FRX48_03642 [Lasallia pustulata]